MTLLEELEGSSPIQDTKTKSQVVGGRSLYRIAQYTWFMVIACFFFFLGLGTLDLASNLIHVLLGTFLLLVSLTKTVQLARNAKHWAVLPFAFLVRQLFFVTLPIALTPHLQDYYRVGSWYFDDLFKGGIILTIENYSFFAVLYLWEKRAFSDSETRIISRGFFLVAAGFVILAIGMATKVAFYYGYSSFLGQSLTKFWFGFGFALLLVLLVGTRGAYSPWYVRTSLAAALAFAVAILLAGTGSRTLLLTPLFCLLGTYSCFRLARFTVAKVASGLLVAIVFAVIAFTAVAGVRTTSYMTGSIATLKDIRQSASGDLREGLRTTLYRLGASAAVAEILVQSPAEFPRRKTSDVIGLFAGAAVSKNIVDLESLLGMRYAIGDSSPGEVMADIIEIEGAAAFPLSCDLYLIGGYGAVALGSVLACTIAVMLFMLVKRLIHNQTILIALLAGVFFPGLAILEVATELAALLLWSMWTLIFLCLLLQKTHAILALPSLAVTQLRVDPDEKPKVKEPEGAQ